MRTQEIGRFRVDRVVESEGPYFRLDFLLPAVAPDLIAANAAWLKPLFIDPASDQVNMSFHSYLLRSGRHTILIDACIGNDKERPQRPNWHRQSFPFLERLAAHGVAPEAVDFVFCTHLHADHVGWNTRLVDGRWVPTFPNARYLFARREYEHWEREHRAAAAQGAELPNHGSFADSVLPVVEAGRGVLVDDGHEIERGLVLEAAPGHTPGNAILHAQEGGRRAVFLGDIIHTAAQLAAPELSSRFCSDAAASRHTRCTLIDRFAESGTTILTGHFPTPTAGRIVRHGGAFRFAVG
jgi:glyoxylase-like metal-dependent hydrolase (beta-lactamase superfamily II)